MPTTLNNATTTDADITNTNITTDIEDPASDGVGTGDGYIDAIARLNTQITKLKADVDNLHAFNKAIFPQRSSDLAKADVNYQEPYRRDSAHSTTGALTIKTVRNVVLTEARAGVQSFDAGGAEFDGQMVTILSVGRDRVRIGGNTIICAGGSTLDLNQYDTITFMYYDRVWRQTGHSDNSR